MGENVAEKDTLFEWSFALKIFILNIITQKWEGARSYLPPKLDYIIIEIKEFPSTCRQRLLSNPKPSLVS